MKYHVEISTLCGWDIWERDERGQPCVYDTLEAARLAIYEEHLDSLISVHEGEIEDPIEIGDLSIVMSSSTDDEFGVRFMLDERGKIGDFTPVHFTPAHFAKPKA
jgi:hypothetical protein